MRAEGRIEGEDTDFYKEAGTVRAPSDYFGVGRIAQHPAFLKGNGRRPNRVNFRIASNRGWSQYGQCDLLHVLLDIELDRKQGWDLT
jgi:hypothetical protein